MRFRKTIILDIIIIILLTSLFTSIGFVSAKKRTVTTEIFVSGNFAYIYVMNEGLQIVDISNPINPQFVSHLKMDYHYSFDMFKVNNSLYFSANHPTSGRVDIFIIDVSNPQKPILIGKYESNNYEVGNFFVSDNLLFIAHEKLEIIDVSNPQLPSKVGEFIISDIYAMGVREDKLYIVTESDGMLILNISTPSAPTLINSYVNIKGFYIALEGDYAIVSNWSAIQIFDISNSSDISLIDSFGANNLVDLFVSDDVIYYEIYSSRIGIVDFSNPHSLLGITEYSTGESINKMFVVDHYIYIAADDEGMLILDTSDPSVPIKSSYYEIYLPSVRNRNIILIAVSAAIVTGGIGISVWQRDRLMKSNKRFISKIKTAKPITIVSTISSLICLLSIITIIISCSLDTLGLGLVLVYTLGPAAIVILIFAPLITWIVVQVKKPKVPIADVIDQSISDATQERKEGKVFCPSCGVENNADWNHCSKCGFKL